MSKVTAQEKPARPQISVDLGGELAIDLEACQDVLDVLYCDMLGLCANASDKEKAASILLLVMSHLKQVQKKLNEEVDHV